MKYLAIPSKTIDWLQTVPNTRVRLLDQIERLSSLPQLDTGIGVDGPLRLAASKRLSLILFWNADYALSSGHDDLGLIYLNSHLGVLSEPRIATTVFEREISIISKRLNNLVLPEPYIHRQLAPNIHTCVSGGSNEARRRTIGYFDGSFTISNARRNIVACFGPNSAGKSLDGAHLELSSLIQSESETIPELIGISDEILSTAPSRPVLESEDFEIFADRTYHTEAENTPVTTVPRLPEAVKLETAFQSINLSYDDWLDTGSPLTREQREILGSEAILTQPLRIVGPAGSGKTLLMQLLAVRILRDAETSGNKCVVLFITHNGAMAENVIERFFALGIDKFFKGDSPQELRVQTLFEYSQHELAIENDFPIIDKDAQETKEYQRDVVFESLRKRLSSSDLDRKTAPLLSQVQHDPSLLRIFSGIVVSEISTVIKGHHLTHTPKTYIETDRPLSRLHAALLPLERKLIFSVFEEYHTHVFEEEGLLDADDLAITLLGNLRTPLWEMKRRKLGVDFLLIDEAQLFNENECKLFSLLTKPPSPNLPVALALDEAQDLGGVTRSGWGLLGIQQIEDRQLMSVHRCSEGILRLAFHIIQKTIDLFTADFPDFTDAESVIPNSHPLVSLPLLKTGGSSGKVGKYVAKQVSQLRASNIRQVCVIVFGDHYWEDVKESLEKETSDKIVTLTRRGSTIPDNSPLVVLTTPDVVGGQEFDAVIAVGLESGQVPPRVENHVGLNTTLEQQSLRAMYLAFTRARYRLIVVVSAIAQPTSLLKDAIDNELLIVSS